ncbi:MAG TPA: hypothetical protein DCZ12_17545 [Gammaproteobacteria bacterium]|nr:hypothetical protein [Gammaproteobacteria bacterium]
MNISGADRQSPLYAKLIEDIDGKVATLRASNDRDHDEISTARIRGRIAELKALRNQLTSEPSMTAQNYTDPYA